MVRLSKRLGMAASLVCTGNVLADVGTDHGYVPIYLLEQKRIPRAIAMDVNRGPIERAREHICMYGMEDYIETRLSDGVAALAPGEAGSILIAGMGGGLVVHILQAGREVCRNAGELVLQPQSELFRVRSFLEAEGYVADAEEMIVEDGKYYPMMRVRYAPQKVRENSAVSRQYGRLLLEGRHPVLLEYLKKERGIRSAILQQLARQPQSEKICARLLEVEQELAWNAEALDYYM
ncbi:MAG: tRNA (adenine(22)-N(1))-methyltransferase [Roseburia sp.]